MLVKWANLNEEDATWEDRSEMQQAYPNFNLEDKVDFKGEGIVMSQPRGAADLDNSRGERENADMELVTQIPDLAGVRKGTRLRSTNCRLKDYV